MNCLSLFTHVSATTVVIRPYFINVSASVRPSQACSGFGKHFSSNNLSINVLIFHNHTLSIKDLLQRLKCQREKRSRLRLCIFIIKMTRNHYFYDTFTLHTCTHRPKIFKFSPDCCLRFNTLQRILF